MTWDEGRGLIPALTQASLFMMTDDLSSGRAARLFLISCLFIVAPVFVPMLPAQNFLLEAGQFENKKITEVEIRYRGARTVDENRLRGFMAVRAGRTYKQASLDEDIRTLYSSGLVDDVQFFAENVSGGVKVIAELVTRPLINGIGFAGNTVFKDRTLANETDLSVGQILSDKEIIKARKNIEEYYQGYGYPDVTVKHRLQATEREGYADLVFVVEEGEKNEIRKILFEGNRAFSDNQLRKVIDTKQKGIFSFLTKSGRINTVALDEDLAKVKDYYQTRGYWRASVGVPRRVDVGDGTVDLIIPVTEGPRYVVNSVNLSSIRLFTEDEIRPALSLVEQMPYSSKKMRDDIRMIRSYYGSRGYADATVVPQVREAGNNEVAIAYKVTAGKVFKVGRVNIQGNTKSQDRVIRRELPMNPGEPFNSVDLEVAKRRLQNLGYFSDVQVNSGGGRSNFRDVNIQVQEKKTGSINFGVGLSSIDNLLGFVTLEQSNFDLSNPWKFTGGGQRFRANIRAGTERKDLSLSITEPWFLGKKLALGGELFYRDSQFFSSAYEQTNAGAAISIRKPVGRKAYVKLRYSLEKVEVEVDENIQQQKISNPDFNPAQAPGGTNPEQIDNPSFSQAFSDENGDYLRSALEATYVYDSRDSNITPRKGEKFEVGARLAGGILAGDVDTYDVSFEGSKHWNLRWDGILTLRGGAEVVAGFGDTDTPPIFERKFLGGSRDLRGFDFRDLGNIDPNIQEALGGNTRAFASLEYTLPLFQTIRGAVFFDAGFVNTDSWDFGFDNLASDIGIGARMNLPLGPLAVDYAFPISIPDGVEDDGAQFQFYLNYQY